MQRSSHPTTIEPVFGYSIVPQGRRQPLFWGRAAWGLSSIAFLVGYLCFFADRGHCQTTDTLPNSSDSTLTTKQANFDGKDMLASRTQQANTKPLEFRTVSFRGKIVWLNEALKERYGISTVPEAAQRSLAILTDDGSLLPILDDSRGRSFRTDQRLREMQVELFVRQYSGQPMLQIIRVYELRESQKYEVDYWCDVCAIIMFETGLCACCQDDNRLRKRLVEK